MRCPRCKSTKVAKFGYVPTVRYGRRRRYRCQSCGKTFYAKKGGKG